jgi:hypothetical protein
MSLSTPPLRQPMRRRNPWVAVGVRVIPPDVSSTWSRTMRRSAIRHRIAAAVAALGLAIGAVAVYQAHEAPKAQRAAKVHVKRGR